MVIQEIQIAAQEGYVKKAVHDLRQDTIIIAFVKGRSKRRLVFLEDADKTRAAAGEGGIEGAFCVKGFVYFFEVGVEFEHGGFEIVDEGACPGVDGLSDDILQGGGGLVGGAKGKGGCRADVDAGVDERESVAGQVEGDRLEPFASAVAQAGGVQDEEGAIAT